MQQLYENPMAKKPDLDNLDWLQDLDYDQLVRLSGEATNIAGQKRRAEAEQLRKEFQEKAEKLGYDPADLFARAPDRAPKPKSGRGISTLPPKYVDKSSGQSWSGKGRRATWLEELVKAGKSQDDYLNDEYVKAKGL
jgi:DNA-binding protein H-NS